MDVPHLDVNSLIENIEKVSNLEKGVASALYQQIIKEVQRFENMLDLEHEVGMRLVNFGQSIQFHVTGIDYRDPHLFFFYGFLDNGAPVKLIQHVSQLSFLLVKVKRLTPNEPKRPIGFRS